MSEYMDLYRQYESDCREAQLITDPNERTKAFAKCDSQWENLQQRDDRPPLSKPATRLQKIYAKGLVDGLSISEDLPDLEAELPRIDTVSELAAYIRDPKNRNLFPFQLDHLLERAADLGLLIEAPNLPSDSEVLAARCAKDNLFNEWNRIIRNAFKSLEDGLSNIQQTNQKSQRLEVVPGTIRIDDEWIAFQGGPKTTERLYEFFNELIATRDYVSMSEFKLKTRDLEGQSTTIRDLFDLNSPTSAGMRIKSEWFNKAGFGF